MRNKTVIQKRDNQKPLEFKLQSTYDGPSPR